jgi:WD40 repeat protein
MGSHPTSVIVSSNGKYIATGLIEGADQNIVKLWHTETEKSQIFKPFNPSVLGRVNLIGFTKDNETILCITKDKIYFLDIKSEANTEKPISEQIKSLSVSPKDEIFATGDQKGNIKIWRFTNESSSATEEKTIHAHGTPNEAPVNSLAFNPNSKILASAGNDYKIKLWYLSKNYKEELCGEHSAPVNVITFSPDGKFLASGDDKGYIKIWDVTTKKNEVLKEHKKAVTSLSFSSDSKTLVSGSKDETIILWKR